MDPCTHSYFILIIKVMNKTNNPISGGLIPPRGYDRTGSILYLIEAYKHTSRLHYFRKSQLNQKSIQPSNVCCANPSLPCTAFTHFLSTSYSCYPAILGERWPLVSLVAGSIACGGEMVTCFPSYLLDLPTPAILEEIWPLVSRQTKIRFVYTTKICAE